MASTPPRTGDNETWYRTRGKVRRPRWVPSYPDDSPATPSEPSGPAGVARERSEPKATRKRAHGSREGHGEGEVLPGQTEFDLDEATPF